MPAQAPPWQDPPNVQELPQAPQLAESTVMSVQTPPQSINQWAAHTNRLTPDGGVSPRHTPLPNAQPGPQMTPHPPQLAGSVRLSTHTPPQSVSPASAQVRIMPSVGGPTTIWAARAGAAPWRESSPPSYPAASMRRAARRV